jgi:hypothetical protein
MPLRKAVAAMAVDTAGVITAAVMEAGIFMAAATMAAGISAAVGISADLRALARLRIGFEPRSGFRRTPRAELARACPNLAPQYCVA